MDESPQAAIQRVDEEIAAESDKLKNLKEQIKQTKESLDEFQEVERLAAELKEAQTKLKIALQSDRNYTSMTEEAAEVDFKIKDLREILSHHVTRYWRETDESQVLLTDGKSAKNLIVTGKLGKKVEAYQERMFKP